MSNTPFREYKHWVHEGGISTPQIAHWPNGIALKGDLRKERGHRIDIAATCVELAGAEYPKKVGDTAIAPLEGKSLVAVFAKKSLDRDAIFWEHEGNGKQGGAAWRLETRRQTWRTVGTVRPVEGQDGGRTTWLPRWRIAPKIRQRNTTPGRSEPTSNRGP